MEEALRQFEKSLMEALDEPNPFRRGAFIAAAKKSCRATVIIETLLEFEQVDWTPTLAGHVIKKLIGRRVDRVFLMRCFGTPGRTDKTPDIDRIPEISTLVRRDVKQQLKLAESEMNSIRETWRMKLEEH